MLRIDRLEGVAFITLSRPPVNALNVEVTTALTDAVEACRTDADLRALVFRSDQRVFCAGADIAMIEASLDRPEDFIESVRQLQRLYSDIERLSLPTIAAMAGAATGGGLELALACDFRIAAHDALLGLPEAKIGLIPGAGGTQRLTEIAGRDVAMRLILGAELVTGREAMQLGVVQWSLPASDVHSAAERLATQLASLSAPALAEAKRCIGLAGSGSRDPGFHAELESLKALISTPEARDGLTRFLRRN